MDCLLSVAMIVRNEEHTVRRALESVKEIADEIIVVDTGSSDKTPEIVKEYTNKVYFYSWNNDFSEARNYSISLAKCKWILIIDADEELSTPLKKSIRDILENMNDNISAIYVPIKSFTNIELSKYEIISVPRIFKNGTVHYKNLIHEQPVFKGDSAKIEYYILHYGYIWTPTLRRLKYEKRIELLKRQVKTTDNINEKLYYMIQLYKMESIAGNIYRSKILANEIIQIAKKSGVVPTIFLEFLYYHASEAIHADMLEYAQKLIDIGLKADDKNPDFYFALMSLYEKKEEWSNVIKYTKKYLEKVEYVKNNPQDFKYSISTVSQEIMGYALLCKAYIEVSEYKSFHETFVKMMSKFSESVDKIKPCWFTSVIIKKSVKDEMIINDVISLLSQLGEAHCDTTEEFLAYLIEKGILNDELVNKIPVCSSFVSALLSHWKDSSKDFLIDIATNNDIENFLLQYGINGLLFLYPIIEENHFDKEIIAKVLKASKKLHNELILAMAYSLLGDTYLIREGKHAHEAIALYKKSMDILPDLSEYIKNVISEIKIGINPTPYGVVGSYYRDIIKNAEFIIDPLKIFNKPFYISKLFLISSTEYAKYLSACFEKEKSKAIDLMETIKDPNKLFIHRNYRLAKLYETVDREKAYYTHEKACEQNKLYQDLKKIYLNRNISYFIEAADFMSENDIFKWSKNISECYSPLGIIPPVRAWKKAREGFFYSWPFSTTDSIKKYFERECNILGESTIPVEALEPIELINVLEETGIKQISVYGYRRSFIEAYKDRLSRFGIHLSESKSNLVIPVDFESINFKDLLQLNPESLIISIIDFDFDDNYNYILCYPGYRFLWNRHSLENIFGRFYQINVLWKYSRNDRIVYYLTRKNKIAGGIK